MTIKTILVSLRGDDMDARCLAVAGGFAQRFKAHVVALFVEQDPIQALSTVTFGIGGGVSSSERWLTSLRTRNEALRAAVKRSFSDWRVAAGIPEAVEPSAAANESAQLVLKSGDERVICEYAVAADLVVTALAERGKSESNLGLEAALIDSGRPVIALPRKLAQAREDGPIVVAWNSTAEAVHALSAALPLMRNGGKVVVLHAGRADGGSPVESVLSYLAWHGIHATGEELGDEDDPEHLIASRVAEVGASMLVMGAYSRSRVREFVFGGVTHHMLRDTQVPLLLAN